MIRLDEARQEAAPACRMMAMSRDRHACVHQRGVALFDDIGRHLGMLRTANAVSPAGDVLAVELHRLRAGLDLAAVVGVVAYPNQIDHLRAGLRACVDCAALDPALYNPPVFRGISNSPELEVVSDF